MKVQEGLSWSEHISKARFPLGQRNIEGDKYEILTQWSTSWLCLGPVLFFIYVNNSLDSITENC